MTISSICGGIMRNLFVQMERLLLLNNTVRSELGRNGGHKGRVNAKVLLWLDHVDRIEKQFSEISLGYLSLVGLVKFIHIRPSSVLVCFANSEVFEEYGFPGTASSCFPRNLGHHKFSGAASLLFPLVKDKIWEYLDDPLIKTVGFYGGEGWIKHKITRKIKMKRFVHQIVRVQLLHTMSLKNLQHYMRVNEDAEVNKRLVIFDYDYKPGLLNKINRKIHNLCYFYSHHSVFKINKQQILNLTNEVKVLAESYSSLQLLCDADGPARVLENFSTRQTLTGKSAQEVSCIILKCLLDPVIGTIGLYGVGGVGKTTIVTNICNELANTDIFDVVIWVSWYRTTNYHDYTKSLQDVIAIQLGLKLLGYEKVEERASRISNKLKIVGKCLLVFDDMWEKVELSTFGIPCPERDNGCKIVLTTRSRHVCTNMDVQKMIYLAPLSDKEAWDLFVSKSGDQVHDPDIRNIAKDITYECGGLPITILTVCHAMKDEINISAWTLALNEIQRKEGSIYEQGIPHLFDVLIFGYNRLLNDQVRACFLSCAIFLLDCKCDSTELIRHWMAENLLHNERGIVESMNDGHEILKELKDANMLGTFIEGGTEWLIMHDLFREVAIIILGEEFDFITKAGGRVRGFSNIKTVKISLITNPTSDLYPLESPCTSLSTLLLGNNPLGNISFSLFFSMPNLQVLDMSYSGLTQLPPSLSVLHKLRVLFLDFCTGLGRLPSLEKLKDLQMLSLRGTLITELPQGIEELVNLRSLVLSDTIRLKHMNSGVISSLSMLEELQLQGSCLCKMESPKMANLFKEISSLKQLGILAVSAVGFGEPLDMILHLQQLNLKIFSVNAYGSTLDFIEDE